MNFSFNDFAPRHEEREIAIAPVYTGLASMYPIAVNPNLAQLQEMGFMYKDEPVYEGEDFNKNKQTNISIYVKHDNPDITHAYTIPISMNIVKSNDGSTIKVINAYGATTYVTKEQYALLAVGTAIEKIFFFIPHGVRPAFDGEEELINFIRIFRGIPRATDKTAKEDLPGLVTQFSKEHFEAFVRRDESALKALEKLLTEKDAEGKPFTVGMVLGARTKDNGYLAQDNFKTIVANYVVRNADKEKSVGWLVKTIMESQQAGSKKNTVFNLHDLTLSEYKTAGGPKKDEKEGLFGGGDVADAFDAPAASEDPFGGFNMDL